MRSRSWVMISGEGSASGPSPGAGKGQAPSSVCQKIISSFSSGARWPSTSRRKGAVRRAKAKSALFHSRGSSESASMRARTSSPRLVSCVAVASIERGKLRARARFWSWKVSTGVPKMRGSPPTSLSETSRLYP